VQCGEGQKYGREGGIWKGFLRGRGADSDQVRNVSRAKGRLREMEVRGWRGAGMEV